jgi:hypothetical protein
METPATNPPGASPPPPENPAREVVNGATADIAAKHAPGFKRGQGQRGPDKGPRRKPGEKAVGADSAGAQVGAGEPRRPVVDTALVKRSVESLCRTVDSIVVKRIYRETLALSQSDELAKALADDAGMKRDELEMISDLTSKVCEQYGIMGEHAPALFLAIAVVGYGTRVGMTLNKVAELRVKHGPQIGGDDALKN